MSTKRHYQDALLRVAALLPNAATTVNSNAIDLGANPAFTLEKVQVKLSTTAGNGANNKNINLVLQHSGEAGANFTNISKVAAPVLTVVDANNAGYAAGEEVVYLPPDAKRYIRASATGEANGGNAANGSFELVLLF